MGHDRSIHYNNNRISLNNWIQFTQLVSLLFLCLCLKTIVIFINVLIRVLKQLLLGCKRILYYLTIQNVIFVMKFWKSELNLKMVFMSKTSSKAWMWYSSGTVRCYIRLWRLNRPEFNKQLRQTKMYSL